LISDTQSGALIRGIVLLILILAPYGHAGKEKSAVTAESSGDKWQTDVSGTNKSGDPVEYENWFLVIVALSSPHPSCYPQ